MQHTDCVKYLDRGKGPAVVLLHDALLSMNSLTAQVEALSGSGFRVVVPDLSGQTRLEDYRDLVIALLDRLGVGRFALCGAGMGGSLALALVERYPARIVALSLLNARAAGDDFHEKYRRAALINDLQTDDGFALRNEMLRMLVDRREEAFDEKELKKIHDFVHRAEPQRLINNLKVMQSRRNYTGLLSSIQIPVLLSAGRDNRTCHPTHAQLMAEQIGAGCRLITVAGGHLHYLEQDSDKGAGLINFLRSLAPQARRLYRFPALAAA